MNEQQLKTSKSFFRHALAILSVIVLMGCFAEVDTYAVVYDPDSVSVTIVGNTASYVYNGEEQSSSGYTVTYTVNGTTQIEAPPGFNVYLKNNGKDAVSATDTGEYLMGLTEEDFIVDAEGYNVTGVDVTDGKLIITRKLVTLQSQDGSWVYDGDEHGSPGIQGIEAFYERDNILVETPTTVQNAGDKKTNIINVTGDTSNYDIETIEGTLEVTPKEVTVTAENKTKAEGEKDPELTATVRGVIGDDVVVYTLNRENGEAPGVYSITPSGEEEQGNYLVKYILGSMTITEAEAVDNDSSDAESDNNDSSDAESDNDAEAVDSDSDDAASDDDDSDEDVSDDEATSDDSEDSDTDHDESTSEKSNTPNTGDENRLGLWLSLLLLSGGTLIAAFIRKKSFQK